MSETAAEPAVDEPDTTIVTDFVYNENDTNSEKKS